MVKNRKSSNDNEVLKGTSSNILADLPADIQALFAIIESLRDTVAAQNRIIESNSSADLPAEIKAFVATIATLNTTIEALAKANESNTRINESQNRSNQELAQHNAELLEKISELTALVASSVDQNKKDKSSKSNDSSNSSIPPSASNPSKSTGNFSPRKMDKNRSLRKRTQEKPGRLPGHEGSGMKLKEVSDRFVNLFPEGCAGCENLVSCMQNGRVCDTRYTTDIVFEALQTEYKNWEFQCPNNANETVQGAFPQEVTGSKQYGPNIKHFAVLLKNIGFVSYKRMAKLCSALGLDLSTGTLIDICNRFADKCKDVRSMITSLLQSSPVLGLDETGGNVNGSKIWHHTTVSEDATLIVAHKNRGEKGTLSAGVIQDYTRTVCHDFWSPYFKFEDVIHAMCAAHLERENNKAQADNPTLKWPTKMNDLFHDLQRARKEFKLLGHDRIPDEVLLPYRDHYDEILKLGDEEDPIPLVGEKLKKNGEPRKPALSKAQNLLKRYKRYKEEVLRFAADFDVPVSNNRAETSFRFFKVAYNVFGCFRTEKGAADFSMMNSVFDTGRKQGLPPKEIVSRVFNGNYLDIFNDECRAILIANGAIPTLA
ncbi:MAG: IS66 family transposase [Spirochaetales bacterium]|nr:IS66 family transposase [Spirochaetales bacterium]